ncbi:AzlC family ABC transporter permease [Aquibium oceanicum]|uniref:Branched-chain amino acid ABC transporter permease n=1 Tax=Aquibium oceanicum TaxID=1670800 RepID=A0A1L3SS65_9HYPH|nr:AzlC family ABC transporter permease [Aquibium oceanicum]APH72248.1 branched-chain amino acid ABC transporter permease [Aquibium oceanicum]
MSALTSNRTFASEFWSGVRLGVPVFVASAPFAVLFGAIAVKNGFTIAETVLMSATIYGGASQMVGIELFGQHTAPWLIVFAIFAVNFRHTLYSAAVGRRIRHWSAAQKILGFFFLVDPQYAETERRAESGREITFVWYMGMVAAIYPFWIVGTWLGAAFGSLIPDTHELGLDFLLPIYFLGLVIGFRKRPFWLPIVITAAVVSVIAHKLVGSPWHISIGALAGVALAASMPVNPEARAAYDEPPADDAGESV